LRPYAAEHETLAELRWKPWRNCGIAISAADVLEDALLAKVELADRFTVRVCPSGGWDVIDLFGKDRVVAHCDDRTESLAIAWFLRGDYECGARLQLEALEQFDSR